MSRRNLIQWGGDSECTSPWVPGLLITSTFIGILGYLIQGVDILFVISGVIFGIGYIGVGFTVWLQPVR